VRVNGRIARLGDSADPRRDTITVDGKPLPRAEPAYWIAHKPVGILTTTRDPQGRPTVVDLLPHLAVRLYPVGRLDRDSEGLVLLTNDGEVAHGLLHPSLGSEREYRVTVRGRLGAADAGRLRRGVPLAEGLTAPARVGPLRFDSRTGTTSVHMTLREGRKRQIRRSMEHLGHRVVRLVRIRMGPLRLGRLARGSCRPLRPQERRALRAHVARLQSKPRTRGRSGPAWEA
jgi:pseudouridine synthase